MKALAPLLAPVFITAITGALSAATVATYNSGVTAAGGSAGAADPTAGTGVASWAWTGSGSNAWSDALDSGNGGWRITDGTSSAGSFYQHTLSAGDATDMNTNGWAATWTLASTHDLINGSGGALDDWITAARQNNNSMWVESASGGYRYILAVNHDPTDGSLSISDGTSSYLVGTNLISEELGAGSVTMNFITLTLTYDPGTGNATLTDSLGGNHGAVATSGSASQERVVWGAISSSGNGSTVWNQVSVDTIPEPSAIWLAALSALGLLRRRR